MVAVDGKSSPAPGLLGEHGPGVFGGVNLLHAVAETVYDARSSNFWPKRVDTGALIGGKRLGLEASLYRLSQVVSVMSFAKTPILRAFQASGSESDLLDVCNQLNLFGL